MSDIEKNSSAIISAVESFKKDHDRATILIETLCNTMTKLTYYNPKKDDILGEFVNMDRLKREVEDEYYEQREKLAKLRRQMTVSLERIQEALSFVRDHPDAFIGLTSVDNLEQMNQSMVQQNLLEDSVIRTLDAMFEQGEIDSDAFITCIAVFKFSPYCNQASLMTFIEFTKP